MRQRECDYTEVLDLAHTPLGMKMRPTVPFKRLLRSIGILCS